jgi:antiviral helicase SLH1
MDQGGLHSKQGKVNILLQAYISQAFVEDFALVSDTMYVAQNGGRILRAVLEIAISQRWASVATVLMGLSKAIEKRMWPFENPMKQFGLSQDLFYNLTRLADDYTPSELAQQTAVELGVLLKMNERHGSALLRAAKRFPSLQVQYKLRPIASDMLRIDLNLIRSFDWDKGIHGAGEPFWLWLEDREGVDILQMEHVYWHPDDDELRVSFHIPLRDPAISQSLRIRLVSDRWLGAENEVEVPLGHIVMPSEMLQHTTLLDVPLLPVDSVTANEVSQRSPFRQFNAMQTQSFWPILHMEANALLSAPAGCGKSMLGYLAMA